VPRSPRVIIPGQPQHVIQRGNNRCALFREAADYQVFAGYLASAIARFGCVIHAYVFMPNHVHFVMTAGEPGSIAKVMQSLGCRYVAYFNERYDRTGTLWEGRYRCAAIGTETYFFRCCRYVESNAVRAGIVHAAAEYRWSSYGANAMGRHDPLVTPHALYQQLGHTDPTRRATYRALFPSTLDDATLDAIRVATQAGITLGDRPSSRGGARPRAGRKSKGLTL
jgi:putative transposase